MTWWPWNPRGSTHNSDFHSCHCLLARTRQQDPIVKCTPQNLGIENIRVVWDISFFHGGSHTWCQKAGRRLRLWPYTAVNPACYNATMQSGCICWSSHGTAVVNNHFLTGYEASPRREYRLDTVNVVKRLWQPKCELYRPNWWGKAHKTSALHKEL